MIFTILFTVLALKIADARAAAWYDIVLAVICPVAYLVYQILSGNLSEGRFVKNMEAPLFNEAW